MTISGGGLVMREEPLRNDQMEFILGARHGHIEKTTLFLDFGRRCGCHVRRDAAIGQVLREALRRQRDYGVRGIEDRLSSGGSFAQA